MGFTITVSGESVEDLKQGVAALCSGASPAGGAAVEAAKKGPGRPAKAAAPTAAEMADDLLGGGEPEQKPAAKAPVKAYTEAEVRARLQELMAARTGDASEQAGIERVKGVLAKVGAQKIKEVPAAKYGELVQHIDLA